MVGGGGLATNGLSCARGEERCLHSDKGSVAAFASCFSRGGFNEHVAGYLVSELAQRKMEKCSVGVQARLTCSEAKNSRADFNKCYRAHYSLYIYICIYIPGPGLFVFGVCVLLGEGHWCRNPKPVWFRPGPAFATTGSVAKERQAPEQYDWLHP